MVEQGIGQFTIHLREGGGCAREASMWEDWAVLQVMSKVCHVWGARDPW